ncbi:telomerase RNA component interacting RNase isoform X2 [Danio rerio]|uniref:Telomerase RNA component interacting RNase isoform X2 n=1 Tax=Danio rerio TaxID=7955 RepID=A0AC58IVG5_DANRE
MLSHTAVDCGSCAGPALPEAPVTLSVCSLIDQVGKRRGGARLALKTGVVAKKQKQDSEAETGKGDAWTKYMAEVKKYKAHQCGDDDKTRPLVK